MTKKTKGQSGGRQKQQKLISERAVMGLRAESLDYEAKYTRAQIESIIKRYATIANKRLAAIERVKLTGSSPAYQHVKKASYSGFSYATKYNRFRTGTSKQTQSELIEELYQLHQFLFNAKTSTIAQIRSINQKRAEAVYEYIVKRGADGFEDYERAYEADPEEAAKKIGEFFREENIKQLVKAYGSKQVLEMVKDIYGDNSDKSTEAFTHLLDDYKTEMAKQGKRVYFSRWRSQEAAMQRLKSFAENYYEWV